MNKKTTIIACAFILSATLSMAQSAGKPVTVRIKKVENINGVEKITDTTYTTTDPAVLRGHDGSVRVIETGEGKKAKIMIVESKTGDGSAESSVKVMQRGEEMDEEIEKALKEAGIDDNSKGAKKVIIIKEGAKSDGEKGERKTTRFVFVNMNVSDASEGECKKAGITQSKEKLVIEDMNCTPNPSSGKFNLKFSSPDKSTADIVIKDINGKIVYTESVKQFAGNYDKEIDLNNNAKGIYFVTITQGIKATTKKLVVE